MYSSNHTSAHAVSSSNPLCQTKETRYTGVLFQRAVGLLLSTAPAFPIVNSCNPITFQCLPVVNHQNEKNLHDWKLKYS